jgi:hypothetical protein
MLALMPSEIIESFSNLIVKNFIQFVKTTVIGGLVAIVPLAIMAFFVAALFSGTVSSAAVLTETAAMELGYKIAAVNEALQNPGAPGALQAITNLGHDQRYYVMVRGWLMYQLQGDMSIMQATQAQQQPTIRARIDFIQQAIRAIDLE